MSRTAYSCMRGNGPFQVRRIDMRTQEVGSLSVEDLDAVAGGMMNDGRGQMDPKAPGAYVPYGGPGMGLGQLAGDLIMATVAGGFFFGF
ncbi:hypothetical protein XH91_17530 [Bradyrhizobium guangzhouense]|nr:hypothetical protein XH91_17530 [Bradyrhizobium guangzhouense]